MPILPWVLTVTAVLVAVVALMRARRAWRRVDRLAESYWELKYECGQLRSRLARLEGAETADDPPRPPGATNPADAPTSFVPLSSLKR